VLTSDTEAEHIPGCNFAVRRDWLLKIGGFDASYRVAGDDVDACWRLQEAGGRIGFHHAALVWHHRRDSVRRYLRQQRGYGRAEALLERKWPQKYNDLGHMRWAGQLYGPGLMRALRFTPSRIYQGPWGSAPFQSLYAPAPGLLAALVQTPEWYVMTALLLLAGGLGGLGYRPLLSLVGLGLLAGAAILLQTMISVRQVRFAGRHGWRRLRLQALTAALHLLQPVARLVGRVEYGLHPFRRSRRVEKRGWAVVATESLWSETWHESFDWLESVCRNLRARGADFLTGQDFDGWDLRIRGGVFGRASLLMVVEEHGSGKQLVRFRFRPHLTGVALGLLAATVAGALIAPLAGVAAATIALWTYRDIGTAVALGRQAVRACEGVVIDGS
jgi:hypothetical protein